MKPFTCDAVRRSARMALLAVMASGLAGSAWGQDQNREREAMRRMQQQLGKLQQDSARTAQEKAELEQKLKAAQESLEKTKKEAGAAKKSAGALAAAKRESAELKSRLDALEASSKEAQQKAQAEIAGLRAQIVELQRTLGETKRQAQAQATALQTSLDGQSQRAQSCEARNLELYGVTADLIKRYKENRGVWEKFLLSEPFTQLKRVEVENLLEDMRERAAAAKIEAKATPDAAGKEVSQ